VAMYGAYAGTHLGNWGPIPPSGKRFEIDVGAVFRIAGDKIAELWITWDNLALPTQIGHLPPQASTG
jgi:predicted ester cyclase